jgi:hypothetical protein
MKGLLKRKRLSRNLKLYPEEMPLKLRIEKVL